MTMSVYWFGNCNVDDPEVTEAVVGGGPGTLASAEATLNTDMIT